MGSAPKLNTHRPIPDAGQERPTCIWCGANLKRRERLTYAQGGVTRTGEFEYVSELGLFCTIRCGAMFGAAAHRAGYRRKAKGS
jgi:hypothetical protein